MVAATVEAPLFDDEDVAHALAMSDDELRDTIEELLYEGPDAEDWRVLLSPEVIRRTRDAFAKYKSSLGPNYGGITDLAFRRSVGIMGWRVRTAFLQAKQQEHWRLAVAYRSALTALAIAVAEHRAAVVVAGLEPEWHDQQMWALLDTLLVPSRTSGTMFSLTEALGAGVLRVQAPHADERESADADG